jgi:DNA polymerase III gamma/tau subunit
MLMMEMLIEARQKMRWESRRRVIIEMAFLKLCRIEDLAPAEEVLKRLGDIEKRLARLMALPVSGDAPKPLSRGGELPFGAPERPAARPSEKPQPKAADAKQDDEKVRKVLDAFGATVVRRQDKG